MHQNMGDAWTAQETDERERLLSEHVVAAPVDDVARIEWWLRRENLRVQLQLNSGAPSSVPMRNAPDGRNAGSQCPRTLGSALL